MAIVVDASLDWSNPKEEFGYDATNTKLAIGWTAQETFAIHSFVVALAKVGSPTGTVKIEIWDDDAGSPGSLITNGTSNTVDVSTLHALDTAVVADMDGETVEFTWPTPPTLNSSSVYYFVITPSWTNSTSDYAVANRRGAAATTNFTAWRINSSDVGTSFTSAFWCLIRKAGTPSYPQIEGFGGLAAANSTTSVDVPYPRTVDANDVLFLVANCDANDTFSTPTGWNLVDQNQDTQHSAALFWRRATGSESGTINVAGTGNALRAGKIFRYSNVITSGTPYEDLTEVNGQGSPATISELTTTDDYELGLCFVAVEDNVTVSEIGTPIWNEGGEGLTATGTDMGLAFHYKRVATAQTVSSSTMTVWGNDYWVTWTLALLPPGVTVHDLTVQEAAHAHSADSPTYSVLNKLAIQECAHAHAADTPTLGYINHLAINECAHYHAADNLTIAKIATLTIEDALHAHLADEPALSYIGNLAIADALHGHLADEPILTALHQLVVADALHAHAAESPTPFVLHQLAVDDTLHAHAAEAPTYSVLNQLAVDDAAHAHLAENLDLIVDLYLQIQDSHHAHLAETPSLSMLTSLSVADSHHAHSADEPTIAVSYQLAIQDAAHAHTAENLILVNTYLLSIDEAAHAHAVDNLTMQSIANLSINDCYHTHTADSPYVVLSYTLAIADAAHDHTADNLELQSMLALAIQDAHHAHSAENLDLVVDLYLQIQDALHDHTADNLALSALTSLTIADAHHAHAADEPVLLSTYFLSVDDALHAHAADEPSPVAVSNLAIADALHDHTAENLDVQSLLTLVIADAWHNHFADQCDVEVVGAPIDLEIDEAHHTHTADSPDPVIVYILNPADCHHAHAADSPAIIHNARNEVYPAALNEGGVTTVTEMALLNLAAWFGQNPVTDEMTSPAESEMAVHAANAFIRLTNITVPSAGVITLDVRKSGSDELTIEVDSTGRLRLLENAVARITGAAGDIASGGDVTLIIDGTTAELYGDGTPVGSYGSLGVTAGTAAELTSLGTGGAIATVEFMPRSFRTLPHNL